MYPPIRPTTDNEASYAAKCIDGDRAAGMALARLLWAKGKTGDITDMVNVAFPLRDGKRPGLTKEGFDRLSDALTEACRYRDFHRVMRDGGIPDRDPVTVGDLAPGV